MQTNRYQRFFNAKSLAAIVLGFCCTISVAEEKAAQQISPEEAQAIIEKEQDTNTKFLMAKMIEKAKLLQEAYGDFSPFAAGLFPNGEVKFIWLAKPGEIVPDPLKAITILRQTLRGQALAGRIMASGIVYKFKVPETGTLQFNTELEYKTRYARLVSTTYTVNKDQKVTLGNVKQAEYDPFIFSEPTPEEAKLIEKRLKELKEEAISKEN